MIENCFSEGVFLLFFSWSSMNTDNIDYEVITVIELLNTKFYRNVARCREDIPILWMNRLFFQNLNEMSRSLFFFVLFVPMMIKPKPKCLFKQKDSQWLAQKLIGWPQIGKTPNLFHRKPAAAKMTQHDLIKTQE